MRAYQGALAIRPDWAEGWWNLGSLQYEGDHYSEAIETFKKLTQVAPGFGPGWNFLGLCEFETKDYANALEHLEKGHALGSADDPEIARVSDYHLALLLVRAGNFDQATQVLIAAFGSSHMSPQVTNALGLALLHIPLLPDQVDPSHEALIQAAGEAAAIQAQDDTTRTVSALQALVKSYPDVPAAHRALAQALQASGDSAQAADERRIAQSLTQKEATGQTSDAQRYARASSAQGTAGAPESLTADWNRAMSDYSAGKYPEAIAELKAYVESDPKNGTAWAVMGLSEFELKDYDNALIHLRRGNDLGFGGSAEAVGLAKYRLATLLNRAGEFKPATELLASEADSGSLSSDAQIALGMSLLRMPLLPEQVPPSKHALVVSAGEIAALLHQSKYNEAFAKFQQLLKAYPATPFLHYTYGVALASLSQYEQAESQMRDELKISPGSELPYLQLASLALRQHRSEDALAPAKQAVKLAPESGEAHYLLGRAYLDLGQDAASVSELEQASKLSPNSPEVHFNLAKAYAKANQPEQAEEQRVIFTRLNALAEQQRSLRGNQSYQGPRDAADVSVSNSPVPAQRH